MTNFLDRFPRIVRPVELTGYAPELVTDEGEPEVVHVWVNPPRDVLEAHGRLLAEWDARRKAKPAPKGKGKKTKPAADALTQSNQAIAAWYANVWSQHEDAATHWTPAKVLALANLDTDPALYTWLTVQTWLKIAEHRALNRKN